MSGSALPFASLFAAVPTPFDQEGKVELPVLDLIIDYLLQQRVEGLALLTEAAEDAFLQSQERRQILERVGAKAEGKVSLLVSISAPSTREAVDLARFAESKGATGILVSPLGIPGLGYRELYRHVDRVGRATSLPVFLTVRPNNAAESLTDEEQGTLAQHPALAGVFLSQPAQAELKAWARRFRKRSGVVFNGCALSFRSAAQVGATASICALSLLCLASSRKVMEGVKRGDVEAVRRIERRSEPALSFLGPPLAPDEQPGVKKLANKLAQRSLDASGHAPWVVPGLVKAGLELQGHKKVSPRVRPPSEQPNTERIQRLSQVLKSAELLS
jgi:dihydrodipicolinate synthase/N-acetylneuraminate lyase